MSSVALCPLQGGANNTRHPVDDVTEEEIKEEISAEYPGTECEFFKKNGEFMGIIKVKFEKPEELNDVLFNRMSIYNQRYKVEKYQPKRRLLRCMKCQMFGHVARLCTSGKIVCGKCTSNKHQTYQCKASEADYKCY